MAARLWSGDDAWAAPISPGFRRRGKHMVRTRTCRGLLRRPIGVALVCSAVLIGVGENPAAGTHTIVTAVQGSGFGFHATGVSLFGGAQADNGPTPTVGLAANASNSPQNASTTTGFVAYGPATLLTSDTITVTTAGSLGTSGSVASTSDIQNVNYASTQPAATGSEVFGYPPPETDPQFINFNPGNLHTRVAGTATANGSGVTGSTTITNGMVRTHAQSSTDCTAPINTTSCGRAGEAHTHSLADPEGVVTIPASPPLNYTVAGHLHLPNNVTDYFVLVFNEQVVNPDGSIRVNPVHEYFGYKLVNGNIVEDLAFAQGGSVLHGHLYLGRVVAGVTTGPGPNAAPVAVDDAYNTPYQTQLIVPAQGVLANDTDADGGTLTAGSASDPPHGVVTLNADGSFTYTPANGHSGPDSFTYTVTDDHGATDSGVVAITVGPPPADLAVAITDSPDPVTPVGTVTYTINVTDSAEPAPAVTLSSSVLGGKLGTVTPPAGTTCTVSKGKTKSVTCNLGAFVVGQTKTVTITATATRKLVPMSLTSTVSSAGDPNPSNNSETENTLVQR